MLTFCTKYGFDPLADLRGTRGAPPLPFAYVFGRSHFTVSFFGANIYPENVTAGLEQPAVSGWVTGKFVLEVAEDADRNPHLAVSVELAPGEHASPGRQLLAAQSIRAQLSRLNSEFAHYVPQDCQTPRVTLLPAGDPHYFPPGVKHRYTRNPAEP
jgi:phenylacetate-CoA ligase